MKDEIGSWEAAYRRRPTAGYGQIRESPELKFLLQVLGDNRSQRILDLGCGDGKHLVYLAKLGFSMYGLDYAPTALRLAADWLAKEDLDAELKCGEMSCLPWQDEHFDAVLATQVIDHNTISGVRAALGEVFRVLRPGGYLLATVLKHPPNEKFRQRKLVEVEPHTYVPLSGHDKDVPHHSFTEDELREFLHQFDVLQLSAQRRFVVLTRRPEETAGSGQDSTD